MIDRIFFAAMLLGVFAFALNWALWLFFGPSY